MFVNPETLEKGKDPGALFAFFHAQRTGGSTFLRWLNKVFPKNQIFSRPTIGADYAHWNKINAARLDDFRVFGGFSQYTDKADMVRPLICFSLSRHPFFRIVSVYHMSKRDKLHYRHDQATRTSLEEFYREVDEQEPSYFRNLICRRICNRPSADAAIETMHRNFGAVTTTATLRDMTDLLAKTYGWAVDPVPPMVPDEERYAGYRSSAIFDDVVEKSAEDLKLYDYVRSYQPPKAAEPAPAARLVEIRSEGPTCSVCGADLPAVGEKGECPACSQPARTRSLRPVLETVVAPRLSATPQLRERPLLAFAATGWERKLLEAHFPKLTGASLYGKYGAGNIAGVDVRDLSRFDAASFSGAFGILLFDYFPEHEKALAELARVIAPGGILFTLILPARVKPDASPPSVTRRIEPRPGYFDYIPEGGVLLNVTVGQDWLLAAMADAGFEPLHLRIPDPVTDEISQWFIGIRSDRKARKHMDGANATAEPSAALPVAAPATPIAGASAKPAPLEARKPARPPGRGPALSNQTRMTEGFSQTFVSTLEGYDCLKEIAVKLTIPSIPRAANRTDFAEHRWLASQNRSGREVNCVGPGQILVSDDLGEHWDLIEPLELAGKTLMNHFTTEAGTRIVQLPGWSGPQQEGRPPEDWGTLYRLAAGGSVAERIKTGEARWHGPRAIGEQNGVILYSEYFDNAGIGTMKPGSEDWQRNLRTCHVWRSDDDGRSWRAVFAKDPTEIRHFHFVMPDPFTDGTWWLSSGDRPHQCHCWRSTDHGETWKDVTNVAPDITLHPLAQRSAQAAFRATDMVITPDKLIWGTDDLMIFNDEYKLLVADPEKLCRYPMPGARIFVTPKSEVLQPRDVGIGSHPFRNFVDVGPGYLAFTEGKYEPIGFEPVVYFVGKDEPYRVQRLFSVPNARGKGTGFSYSRASRAAVDGRFFSFRGSGDLAAILPRMLQWDVAFA